MAAVPDGRSATRIKRKPPPAFPYSPRYPLPDPSDPFAPLQVLRERAHSSHSHAFLNHSNSSLVPSAPSTGESERFASRLPVDATPPPRAFIHASRSTEAFEQFRDGYHSDITRPPRPPRARTRPARDSKSYFSDADLASTQPTNHRHHNQDQHPSEKLTERQYHYRRRSQTLSFFPHALPQVPSPAEEPERPVTEESSRGEGTHHPNQIFHPSQNQYVYDDRQSHGHVYGQAHDAHPSSTVDSHCHSQLQLSVHSGPVTPPMTPDDTLTDRSESVLSDIPPPPPKHVAVESDAEHAALDTGGRVQRELSKIRTSDFPSLLGKSEPDSPPPLPVPPPRPRQQPVVESEPEPEQEYSSRRRSGFGSRDRKDSITHRLRRSSFLARARKVSDPSPPVRTRRLPAVRDSIFGPSSHASGQTAMADDGSTTARNSTVPEVLRTSGASAESQSAENKRAKMSHRKSLSHVSLGVTPLPNVSFGPSASPAFLTENVSMASTLVAYPDGDEFGGPAPSYSSHSQPAQSYSAPSQPTQSYSAPSQPTQSYPAPSQPAPSYSAPSYPASQPAPSYPAPSQHAYEVEQPQPRPLSNIAPQTLAQALDLTPLPPKDAPLPAIRKDARLPTPPRESSMRSSRAPTSASMTEYSQRRETQLAPTRGSTIEDVVPETTAHTTFPRPLTPINGGRASSEMEMDEVILMRSSRFEVSSSEYEQEHPSPSPPLLANSLLVRPTSAATAISIPPPPVPAPLVSPAPVAPHINVPVISVSLPPVRPEIGSRRGSTPPPPPPRRGPSPPALRREPSPLPAPPREEFGPPTPAPLPLSPPRRMESDFPTPLPQPPLPPPSQPPVPRAKSPVHPEERPRAFSPEPAQESSRPRTPHESRSRRSEERRSSEDRQERGPGSYLPVAQVRPPPPPPPPESPPPPQTSAPASRSRTKLPQPSTPYSSVRQRRPGQGQGTTQSVSHTQLPFRPQSPSTQQHAPSRAQSPQAVAVVRTQPSLPAPPRAHSPQPVVVSTRAQSPPPFRAQSPPVHASIASAQQIASRSPPPPPPPPSSYNAFSHGHMQTRTIPSQPSSVDLEEHERERDHGRTTTEEYNNKSAGMSVESTASPPYAASVESTPLPLPNTPSTTFSYPYRAPPKPARRARSSHGMSDSEAKPRARSANATRRQHREREEPSVVTFDEHAGLTKDQVQKAAALTVIAQNGIRVPFGDLFKDRKTIVVFIRHFWCAMCQDYMYSISRNVDFEALKRAGIDFVIIGNGSPNMIKSYRNIFRTPIPMYTDPTLRLYAALGMTLRTNDPGLDSEKGEYVRHGVIGGIAMVVRNALRVGMPVWERGGDATQLGGEFVIGPGFNCSYAHRMTTTRSHAPIREVLRAAGYHRAVSAAVAQEGINAAEEDAWMEERRRSLARMRARKEKRREFGTPAGNAAELYEPELGYGSDTGSGSVSANGSWVSTVEKEVPSRPHPRERSHGSNNRTRERRGKKGLHISNPDIHEHDVHEHPRERHEHHKEHSGGRVHVARHEADRVEWSGGSPTLTYINEYGRREDGYQTEDGTLAYTYRQG